MDDRESLIRLGTYLGVIKDSNTARRLLNCLENEDAGKWLFAAAEILDKPCRIKGTEEITTIIRSIDFDRLRLSNSSVVDALARQVYERLAAACAREGQFPAFDVFLPYFYQYLNRVETTVRGALFTTGIKNEIVDLANPLAFETIAELRHLPGRKYGETSALPGNVRQVTAMVRYVHILIDRYDKKCLGKELSDSVRQNLDRLSAYPWYFTMQEKKRKAEAARPLTRALEKLRDWPENEQDKQDLITALSIVLFNILPSLQLAEYITTLRPGPANRYLRHGYFALLALNSLLADRPGQAAQFAEKAYEIAPEADLKAYDCLLSGFIKVRSRDYEDAIKTFDAALRLAVRKTRSLIKFYTGVLQYEMGNPKLAIDSFREARAGSTDECDAMTLGNNIGTCYMVLGDPLAALKAFEEAESSFQYTGRLTARQMRTVTYGQLGIVYLSLREFELAASYFRKALKTSREAGNARGVADQLLNIGLTAKGKKEYAAAANYFASALNYSCSIDYVEGVLYSREQLRQVLALDCRHGDIRPIERDVIKRHPRFSSLLMARRW